DVARIRQEVADGALRAGKADIAADLLGTAGPMAADAAEAIGFIQGLLAQRGA
ncbi:MAG: damage-inducible protein CinA, partial [Alphaproteobacteria bacterium]|nr:damage-inducible protein CinA [Alphaproteobacteria bacterium]